MIAVYCHPVPTPVKTLVLVNPIAGRGRARACTERFISTLRALGGEAVVIESEAAGAIERHAREWVRIHTPHHIVLVGGDGTLHEFAQHLSSRHPPTDPPTATESGHVDLPPWTVLPVGTGNTLADEHRLTRDPERLARGLASGDAVEHQLPVGEALAGTATRRFLLFAGFGLDATAIDELERRRAGGTLRAGRFAWADAMLRVAARRTWRDRPRWTCSPKSPTSPPDAPPANVDQVLATLVSNYGGVLRVGGSSPEILTTRIRGRAHAAWLGGVALLGRRALDRFGGVTRTAWPDHPVRITADREADARHPTVVQLDGSIWPAATASATAGIELSLATAQARLLAVTR